MENYDGSVIIKTGLDLNTIEGNAEQLKKMIEEATKGVKELQSVAKSSSDAQVSALVNANAKWSEQLGIVKELQAILRTIPVASVSNAGGGSRRSPSTNVSTETEEYRQLQKELEKAEAQFQKLYDRELELQALYGEEVGNLKSYQLIALREENLADKIKAIKGQMKELEAAGLRFMTPTANATSGIASLSNAIATDAKNTQKATTQTEKLTQSYTALSSVVKQAKTETIKTTKAIQTHSGDGVKNVLKYAFGIRSMFFLMRRLRAIAKESLGLIAQYDPKFNSVVSQTLTKVKQLKADLGTMLQPLIQSAAPVFNYILDKVHAVSMGLSKFFAALAGQNYIEKATVSSVDLADSLDDVSEKADKALGSYDKLNVISDSSKQAAKTLALTKDTVKYTKEALDSNSWTVKLGRRLREIWLDAKEAVNDIIDKIKKTDLYQLIVKKLKKVFEDPDKLLVAIGLTGFGILLGKRLLKGIASSGLGSGILGLLPKVAAIAITAYVGYKIGNKIYDSFSEEFKDELADVMGAVDDFFGDYLGLESEAYKLNKHNWEAAKDMTAKYYALADQGEKQHQWLLDQGYDEETTHRAMQLKATMEQINQEQEVRNALGLQTNELVLQLQKQRLLSKYTDEEIAAWQALTKEEIKITFKAMFEGVDVTSIKEKFKTAFNNIKTPIVDAFNNIKDAVKNAWSNAFNFDTSTAGNKADSAGQSLASKFISGIKGVLNTDTSVEKSVTEKVVNAVTSGINIAGSITSGISTAISRGSITPMANTLSTATNKQGDIVLKLDGKTVSKVVWDNTAKQYKQTGLAL